MKKYLFLLFAVFVFQLHAAEKNEENNIEVGTLDVTTDHSSGEWITVKTIDIATQPQNDGCGFLCASSETLETGFLSYGKGAAELVTVNSEKTITTTDGDMYVRLTYENVEVKETLTVTAGNNNFVYEKRVAQDSSDNVLISDSPCSNSYGKCQLNFKAGLVSGRINIQIKLPPALSKKSYVFSSVDIGSLKLGLSFDQNPGYINVFSNTVEKKITVSGSISVPDRCFLTIGGSDIMGGGEQNITFSDVDADKLTSSGVSLSDKTLKIGATCYGVKGGSKPVVLDAKLSALSGTDVDAGYIFKLKNKNSVDNTTRYLGVIARALSTGGCSKDDNTMMNDSYVYIGQVVVANAVNSINSLTEKPLTFSLCSFGEAGKLLMGGGYTGSLKLTTRWSFK